MSGDSEQDGRGAPPEQPPFLLPRATPGGGTAAARLFHLRRGQAEVGTFRELATLRRWLAEGRARPEDELSSDGRTWQRLADIPQLAAALPATAAGEPGPAGRVATPPAGRPSARQTLPFAGTPPGGRPQVVGRTLPFGVSRPPAAVPAVPLARVSFSGRPPEGGDAPAPTARSSGPRAALPRRQVRSARRAEAPPRRGRWWWVALAVAGALLFAVLQAGGRPQAASAPLPSASGTGAVGP